MRNGKLSSDGAQLAAPLSTVVIVAMFVFSFGACQRQNSAGFRLASTSDPPANNNASGNVASNNTAPGPMGSYADVVSRVAPAVITIHSQLRVRAPQQFPFMDDPFFRQF